MQRHPILLDRHELGSGVAWRVQPPVGQRICRPGQYYLLRCGTNWSPYLRQPLFPCFTEPTTVTFWGNPARHAGLAWLATQPDNTALDLLGPLGTGFSLHPQLRRLVLVAESDYASPLLALIEPQLAQQGSVGLLLLAPTASDLLPPSALPPAVEYYTATTSGGANPYGSFAGLLPRAVLWADQVCAAGSAPFLGWLKERLRELRFDLRTGFAQAVAPVPLPCGVGACLACLVDTGRGWHRACRRGPVFDLAGLAL